MIRRFKASQFPVSPEGFMIRTPLTTARRQTLAHLVE